MAVGLRERKKVETSRAIARVALELALEHGPDRVTIQTIADGAEVSPRTVHNYFGSRDEAILGVDPERRAALCAAVLERPADEPPVDALRTVLVDAVTNVDDTGRLWRNRARLVAGHPQLHAAQAASQAAIESELAAVVATRCSTPAGHPYPNLVAAACLAVLRVALEGSSSDDRTRLRRELQAAFRTLATGLRPPGAR